MKDKKSGESYSFFYLQKKLKYNIVPRSIVNFRKGRFYEIWQVDILNSYCILVDDSDVGFSFVADSENVGISNFLNDYFYTEKEIRKMKLNKLKNVF